MASAEDSIVAKGLAKASPYRDRFKAWWDGEDSVDRGAEPELMGVSSGGSPEAASEAGRRRWTPARMDLVQQVWGSGWTGPGGEQGLLDLVQPLDLKHRMKVLVLGAALGAANRLLAERFGVTAKGLEADPALAEAGVAQTIRAGLMARAPVRAFSPASFKAKHRAYDGVIAKEFLFSLAGKDALLRQAGAALKPGGGLVMTDYVLPPDGRITPAIKAWIQKESLAAEPWTLQSYRDQLARLELEVQSSKDLSEATGRAIALAWAAYTAKVDPVGFGGAAAAVMIKEAELWAGRVKLLESGDLLICHIHAVKNP